MGECARLKVRKLLRVSAVAKGILVLGNEPKLSLLTHRIHFELILFFFSIIFSFNFSRHLERGSPLNVLCISAGACVSNFVLFISTDCITFNSLIVKTKIYHENVLFSLSLCTMLRWCECVCLLFQRFAHGTRVTPIFFDAFTSSYDVVVVVVRWFICKLFLNVAHSPLVSHTLLYCSVQYVYEVIP